MGLDQLMESMESKHAGHELPPPKTAQIPQQTQLLQLDGATEEGYGTSAIMGSENRRSFDSDQFVDALTSPVRKPKDWGDGMETNGRIKSG
jgi:hypothetical protein